MPPDFIEQTWPPPPPSWQLDDDVHVWSASLDQPADVAHQLTATLSQAELLKVSGTPFAQEQLRYSVGRGLLRQILAAYLKLEPAELAFRYGPHGKPALANGRASEFLQFNLSHSGSLAIYAVAWRRNLGVDVEEMARLPEADEIANTFFTEADKLSFHQASAQEKHAIFFDIWTRKEAISKCSGLGIADEESSQERSKQFDGKLARLTPASGYTGTLAVEGPPAGQIRTWRWVL
jgi:4'-phosphopantetheinyl transferase